MTTTNNLPVLTRSNARETCAEILAAGRHKSRRTLCHATVLHDEPRAYVIRLFGNPIIRIDKASGLILISTCGWWTVTTRQRLKALLRVHLSTDRKGQKWAQTFGTWDGERWTSSGPVPFEDVMILPEVQD